MDTHAQQVDTDEEESCHTIIRKAIDNLIGDDDEIMLPKIVGQACRELRDNRDFRSRFFDEALYATVYRVASHQMAQTRKIYEHGSEESLSLSDARAGQAQKVTPTITVNKVGRPPLTPEQVKERAAKVWSQWREHVDGRYVLIEAMNKSQLYKAAEEREKRGDREIRLATLWRQLAEDLRGDEVVGDVFDSQEVQEIWESLTTK